MLDRLLLHCLLFLFACYILHTVTGKVHLHLEDFLDTYGYYLNGYTLWVVSSDSYRYSSYRYMRHVVCLHYVTLYCADYLVCCYLHISYMIPQERYSPFYKDLASPWYSAYILFVFYVMEGHPHATEYIQERYVTCTNTLQKSKSLLSE